MHATPAEVQRLLAAEFDRQGWEYDLAVGREILTAMDDGQRINARTAADSIPATFFDRNRTNRSDVAAAIDRALGPRALKRDASATLVIADNRFQVHLGPGAKIVKSNFNVGDGTLVVADVDAPKDEIIAAVEAVVRGGLAGKWANDAAQALAAVIDKRDDVSVEDVRDVTASVVRAEQPKQKRVKELLTTIATGGLAGALATGISSGLGELISQLPL